MNKDGEDNMPEMSERINSDLTEKEPVESKEVKQETDTEIIEKENERIQRTEWIHNQLKLQRQAEDEAWEKIMQEQKLLTERRRSINSEIENNRELKRYHEDCLEDIADQVYSMHGLSADRLEGMKAYKNALFQGKSFVGFGISVVIFAISVMIYGATSTISMFILACIGTEGALLSLQKRGMRALYFIPLVLIAAEIISINLYRDYTDYVTMTGEAVLLLLIIMGTAFYFVQNPYRKDRKNVRAAKADLKELHKVAKKNVKKNSKVRIKTEKKENRKLHREKKIEKLKFLRKRTSQEKLDEEKIIYIKNDHKTE